MILLKDALINYFTHEDFKYLLPLEEPYFNYKYEQYNDESIVLFIFDNNNKLIANLNMGENHLNSVAIVSDEIQNYKNKGIGTFLILCAISILRKKHPSYNHITLDDCSDNAGSASNPNPNNNIYINLGCRYSSDDGEMECPINERMLAEKWIMYIDRQIQRIKYNFNHFETYFDTIYNIYLKTYYETNRIQHKTRGQIINNKNYIKQELYNQIENLERIKNEISHKITIQGGKKIKYKKNKSKKYINKSKKYINKSKKYIKNKFKKLTKIKY